MLIKVREEDTGVYICAGTMSDDHPFEAHSEILVGGKL